MHAVEECLVSFPFLSGYILVENRPKFGQNWSFDDLGDFVCRFNATQFDFFGQNLVFGPHHLELKLLLGVRIGVQGNFAFDCVGFADDGVSEYSLAEDRVEIIVVQLRCLALNDRLNVLNSGGDIRQNLQLAHQLRDHE